MRLADNFKFMNYFW